MLTNLMLIIAVSFWGLSFIATKKVLQFLTPSEVIAARLILGTPVIFAIALIKGVKFRFDPQDLKIIIIASIILGAHFLIQNLGLLYTSATNTAWLIATIPAFVAVLSRFFLKELLTGRKVVGIILGTAGVMLLISKGDLSHLDWLYSFGDWLVLFTCITWSVYTIITRNITRKYNPLSLIVVVLSIPMISLALVTLISTPMAKFTALSWTTVGALLFLGIGCIALAQWFWLEGLSRKGAVEVGAFIYLEPVVTTLAARPLLGEDYSMFTFISAALILLGVYLVEKKKAKSLPQNEIALSND